MKASSGINALNLVDSDDSEDKFAEDVLKSGRGLSSESLVRTLVKESSAAMDFLQGQCKMSRPVSLLKIAGTQPL